MYIIYNVQTIHEIDENFHTNNIYFRRIPPPHTVRNLYMYINIFIPTDDWGRPMKHFVLEEIFI